MRGRDQWLKLLSDPVLGVQTRLMLRDVGSEFAVRQVLDCKRESHATNGAAATLIGPAVSVSDQAAGSRKLVVPAGEVLILEELNYWYQEDAGGSLTAAINGCKLKLLLGKEQLPELPEFTLADYHRGDASLRFGAIPLRRWVSSQEDVTLTFTPSGTAGGLLDLYVSLSVRKEPRWLMEAALLVDPAGAGR